MMKRFTKLLMLLLMTVAYGNSFSQTLFSSELFPNSFNSSLSCNINTSCNQNTGTWGCFSNCSHGYVSVNSSSYSKNCFKFFHKAALLCGTQSHCIGTSPNVNCNTTCVSAVSLCFKISAFSLSSLNSSYNFYVEVSKDNGSTWTTVYSQSASQLFNTCGGLYVWKDICVSIPASFYTSTFKYRFRSTQNAWCGYNTNVCVDNVCIKTTPCLSLGNQVWLDANGNNFRDAGEAAVPGATVRLYLDANNDNVADGAAIATTTTNTSGVYGFSNLQPNNYIVGVVIPNGYTRGANSNVDPDNNVDNDNNGVNLIGANQPGGEIRSLAITLAANCEPTNDGDDANGNQTLDIALCPAPTMNLGNLVWLDSNGNNTRDAGEPAVPGATVRLYLDANNDNVVDGAAIQTTTTDANGLYAFRNLNPNNYIVGVVIPNGYTRGANSTVDPDNNVDNDNNGVNLIGANQPGGEIRSLAITLALYTEPTTDGDDNNGNLTLDIALCPAPTLTLGNLVWLDVNGNNVKDATEPGVPGATVRLYLDANNDNVADGAAVQTTTTNASGIYTFSGLTSNNYIVGVVIPNGYTRGPITTVDPDNDVDNDNNGVNLLGPNQPGSEVRSLAITLASFTEPTNDGDDNNGNQTLDIALCPPPTMSLGNLVWLDVNGNNVKDATEPGVPGATVRLYLDANNDNIPDGAAVQTTTTNASGAYAFNGLSPNNYIVGVIIPNGYTRGPITTVDPDNDVDNDNNGVTLIGANQPGSEVRSLAITLALYTEPTNDGDDNNGNQTLDIALCPGASLTLGNLVWLDINGNGTREATEPGIPNATVRLYVDVNNDNIADGAAVQTTTTNASGIYTFTGLANNNYIVGVVIPTGFSKGPDSDIDPDNDVDNDNNAVNLIGADAAGGEVRSLAITLAVFTEPTNDGDDNNGNQTLDLALCPAQKLNLGNFVWNDYDGDGKKDQNEPGIPGAPISLYRDVNGDNIPDKSTPIATTVTDSRGFYSFTGLIPGRYITSIPVLPGYSPSPSTSTQATSPFPDNNVDNDNNAINIINGVAFTNAITLTVGDEPTDDGDGANGNLTMDMALCGNAFIGDFVWNDINGNGIQDAGEPGLNGQTVQITFSDGTIATTQTLTFNGRDGYYDFKNLGPDTYIITFTTPAGLAPSPANQGTDRTVDSDPINGSATVTLTANVSNFTIDAGFTVPSICGLGNQIFIDMDGNGVRDTYEPGVPGTTVNLYNDVNGDNAPDGAAIATTTTGSDGTYNFRNLPAGPYIVGVVLPAGYGFIGVGNPLPNNDIDNDNNGVRLVGNEVQTNFILLSPGTEPTNDGDDANINSTLDIGLKVTAACRSINNNAPSTVLGKSVLNGTITTEQELTNSVSMYPNPAVSNFTLKINSDKQSNAAVWITDLSGKIVSTRNLSLMPGTNVVNMNADNRLSAGVYNVQTIVNGKVTSKRLVITK